MSEDEKARYRGAYCGLCHALGKRCGFPARFTLNYDFTLLAMLFAPAQPEVCERRCPVHPFRRRRCCASCPGLEAAADESVILFWWKLRDDAEDKGLFPGLPARLGMLALRRGYRRAAARCPEFDARVEGCLRRLRTLEGENCPSLDRTADEFGEILKAAVPPETEKNRRRVLEQLLYHLGRWVYLADAWDDLEEDRRAGRYNPLLARFPGAGGPEGERDYIRTTMTHSVRLAVSAFQLEDFGVWSGVIGNILYRGLPAAQEAVLEGRWREVSRGRLSAKRAKRAKEAEEKPRGREREKNR